MISTGIRELKDRLSHYVRQVEAGRRISVTVHGRVVAELVPPAGRTGARARYDELVAAGAITRALETGAVPAEWPEIRMPPGSVGGLIEGVRGEP